MTEEEWLVTGFPGFRARALVRQALALDDAPRLVLLAQRDQRSLAEEALAALGGESPRCRMIEGDASAIDFGLSGARYLELAERVQRVHHLHQALDRQLDDKAQARVNVGGAREILEFAGAARALTRVVHYSSVFVSGDRTGVVLEEELEAGQHFRSEGEESLALAEAMLRRAGLPLTVLRAGQVVGDSVTGEVERLDGPYPLIAFVIGTPSTDVPLPLPSKADAELPLVPVDFVARVGVLAGRAESALGQTLHVFGAESVSARRLVELVAQATGKRVVSGLAPAPFTKALLRNPGARYLAQSARALQQWMGTPVRYDDARARALFAALGIERPRLESYLPQMIEHVRARLPGSRLDPGEETEAVAD